MECLYRTADQFDFLLKGDFKLNGQYSEMEKMCIEPMTRTEAKSWALLHAAGQDVSHV